MREVSGAAKSGKTRYVIKEYIVPKLHDGITVYYYGEMSTRRMIEEIYECSGDVNLEVKGKFIGLGKLEDLELIEGISKGAVLVVDKTIGEEDADKLKIMTRQREVIKLSQLASGETSEKGNIIDNGKYIKFNPITFEIM